MKLLVNLSMLGPNPTGLGVYSEHCATGLAQYRRFGVIAGSGTLPPGEVVARAPASISIGGGTLAAIRRQIWMRSLQFGNDTLVYSPTHHGLPGQAGQVITIHDLISLRFPAQHKPQYLFFRYAIPRLLRQCRAVFTVSETTRHDVAKTYGYPLERIYVVPNGVDRAQFSAKPSERPSSPFLLMVGARYQHKNVDEVLDVGQQWARDFRLVITSCIGPYKAALVDRVKALGLQDRVEFRDYVSRSELIQLYQGCSALLYPSKWEGFGIPPLEALACGSPVIASDIPVHREVLGDSALFVRLGDPTSWATAFEGIRNDATVAALMRTVPERLERFTWAKAVSALERSLMEVEPRLAGSRRTNGATT